MAFTQGQALIIGVGTHKYESRYDVPITVLDAQAVVDTLKDNRVCGYPAGQVNFLHNETATRAGILAALDEAAQRVRPDETLFFFYCGHGAMGTDGSYYLVSHDAKLAGGRVAKDTGVSEKELIDGLRKIPAKRVLMIFNACFSGNISPTLAIDDVDLETGGLPENTSNALLGTGEGRIIITASRETQKSYIGPGPLTIFTQALVDGLKGRGGKSSGGYISAYGLYEYIYEEVSDAVKEKYQTAQEPELTVLKAVGPFAVALYRGAQDLGTFDETEAAPDLPAVRQVRPEKAQRALNNYAATLNGSGAIAQGDHAQAVGAGGVLIGGSLRGNVVTGNNNRVTDTGGGAYVGGNVNTSGGDFVGRDKTVHGDEVHGDKIGGDKVGGDKINVGNITDSKGIAIGRGAHASVREINGLSAQDLAQFFAPLMQEVKVAPVNVQPQAEQKVEELKQEISKGENGDDEVKAGLIEDIVGLIPGAVSALVGLFATPALSGVAGSATKFVLKRLQKK